MYEGEHLIWKKKIITQHTGTNRPCSAYQGVNERVEVL